MTADTASSTSDINADVEQQQASRPDASVWVSASAGSGKTKILADRVLRLMMAGADPSRILCLTFTRAGAAEMQIRIRERLAEWAIASDDVLTQHIGSLTGTQVDAAHHKVARSLFASVLDTPGGMKIQTIHAFCESLLGRFPLEAGVAPHFTVMDERSARETLESTRNEILVQAWKGQEADLANAINIVTGWANEKDFAKIMREIVDNRGRIQRLIEAHENLNGALRSLRILLDVGNGETGEDALTVACRDLSFDGDGLRQAVDALSTGTRTDKQRARTILDWIDNETERVTGFDAYARAFLTATGAVRQVLATKSVCTRLPTVEDILRGEAERLAEVLRRRKALRTYEATAAILNIADRLTERFDAHKRQHALLDYDDLILRARALLERAAPWVLYKLDGGLDHILIDEAQDSNADQWAVVQAITAEFFAGEGATDRPRSVFAVGDEKQSIFRFQGAEPEEFARMGRYFEEKSRQAHIMWSRVPLEVSFRSTESVLKAVDAVFAPEEIRKGVSGMPIRHRPYRRAQAGCVELWPPVLPEPGAPRLPWSGPEQTSETRAPSHRLARMIAARIHTWISSGEQLESTGRPIRPGDVMILVRRRTEFVARLISELRSRNIDVAGVDRMALREQLAVWDLLAAARFALLPEDDLNLAALLKGPFIGFDEQQLFEVCHGRGSRSVWSRLRRRTDEASRNAARFLSEVLRQADIKPPFEFFAHILGPMRGRNRIIERLGDEANDPIDETLALALAHERIHTPSLSGFLHWFEQGETEIVRDMSQATRNEVRILTVHGAKGLQAPIVFLADTMQIPPAPSGLMWSVEPGDGKPFMLWTPRASVRTRLAERIRDEERERQFEEYRRLLYVAMTRAEDRLYVCGYAGKQRPDQTWYDLVRGGLEGIAEQFDFASEADDLERATPPGLRLRNTQSGDPDRRARETSVPGHIPPLPDWVWRPAPGESRRRAPVASTRLENGEPTVISPMGDDRGRAYGRGILIHKLLQHLPCTDESRWYDTARRFLERPVHQLDHESLKSILDETLTVLRHPDFRSLFAPDSRAEVPVIGRIGDVPVSGRIDRLVVLPERVRILDFKTNRPRPTDPGNVPVAYLRQMAAYRAILSQVFEDRQIECLLLWTDGPVLMTLDPDLLDSCLP